MTFKFLLKNLHRYAGIIISLQVSLWVISGVFMYFWDRSDLYYPPHQYPLQIENFTVTSQQLTKKISQETPDVVFQEIISFQRLNKGYFQVKLKSPSKTLIFDQNGSPAKVFNSKQIEQIARDNYSGSGPIKKVELLKKSSGNYISSKPIYKVNFDDAKKNEMYISPQSGQLLARRNGTWNIYNILWEIHLMKYFPLKIINSFLLFFIGVLTLTVILSGVYKFAFPHQKT